MRNMITIRPHCMLISKENQVSKNARALMASLVLVLEKIEKTCID